MLKNEKNRNRVDSSYNTCNGLIYISIMKVLSGELWAGHELMLSESL